MGKIREWTEQSRAKIEQARQTGLEAIDQHAQGEPIKALVINLETSRDRYERVAGHLEQAGVAFDRAAGTRGHDLPIYAVKKLAPYVLHGIESAKNANKRFGTLGCWLGHIKAWERAASSTENKYHLILEDDAVPYGPMPRTWEALGVDGDFDICFCNHRMEPLFGADEDMPTKPTLFTALEARSRRPPGQAAIGGDAYFVSREGARKLLDIVDRVGTMEHVDWWLFVVALTEAEVEQLRPDDRARKVCNRFRRYLEPARDIRINAKALWPALVHGSGMPTTRKEQDDDEEAA